MSKKTAKIKNINIDNLFATLGLKIPEICNKVGIPPENHSSFFENLTDSLRYYIETEKSSVEVKMQRQIFKALHEKTYKILLKRGQYWKKISVDPFDVTEVEQIDVANFVKNDIEEVIKILEDAPKEIIIFLKNKARYDESADLLDKEKISDPLLQDQAITLLSGLCTEGAHPHWCDLRLLNSKTTIPLSALRSEKEIAVVKDDNNSQFKVFYKRLDSSQIDSFIIDDGKILEILLSLDFSKNTLIDNCNTKKKYWGIYSAVRSRDGQIVKKGRNRTNGKVSRPTLHVHYPFIDSSQNQRGRPKEDNELWLCWSLGIDYYNATGILPYRKIKGDSPLERGPFVTLVSEIFQIIGVPTSADDLVKKYLSRGKEQYEIYVISNFDKMREYFSSALSLCQNLNAIILVGKDACFIRNGKFVNNLETLKTIKIPDNFEMEDFLKNKIWEINNKNMIKICNLIAYLTTEAVLPNGHPPKKVIPIGL